IFFFFFFFSSRRRHTRSLRDWSSDVCSSDLEPDYPGMIDYVGHMALELIANSDAPYHDLGHTICVTLLGQEVLKGRHLRQGGVRSEERRVGKECRSRWATDE